MEPFNKHPNRRIPCTTMFGLLLALFVRQSTLGQAPLFTITVPATSSLFLAGADSDANHAGDDLTNATPLQIPLSTFRATPALGISFAAEALWALDPNGGGVGPDGGGELSSYGPLFGIGQVMTPAMGLVGMFIDGTSVAERGDPPPAIGDTRGQGTVMPRLFQPFFIGTGTNIHGVRMIFVVPDGATSLVLGPGDSGAHNNIGSATVRVHGEGFTRFQPRRAAASAQVVNGFLVGVDLLDSGFGYTNAPTVGISGGGGSGAVANAMIANGTLTGIDVLAPGSGYTSAPSIHIDPPPIPPRRATANGTVVNGFLVAISVIDGGSGYLEAPVVRISGGGGSGAKATAIVRDGVVTGISITDPGTGYTSNPVIQVASPLFTPRLSIEVSRVNVHLRVVLGSRYQLLSSNDLDSWTPVGDPFIAEAEDLVWEFPVDSVGRYFAIDQVP